MDKPIFIRQLPITEQRNIIMHVEKYLFGMGVPEDKITECLENIMDEKICNVLNSDGTLIR